MNIKDLYFEEYMNLDINKFELSLYNGLSYGYKIKYKVIIQNTLNYQRFALKRAIQDFGIECMKQMDKLFGKILYKVTKKL